MSTPPTPTPQEPAGPPVAVAEAPQPKLEDKTKLEDKSKQLPPYNVVLLDDDHHTYEYVIEMAMKIFGHQHERAYMVAKTVDTQKRAVLLTTHKEHAELKRDQVRGYGRDYRMANCQGSMSCIIEPATADGDSEHSGSGNNLDKNSGGKA